MHVQTIAAKADDLGVTLGLEMVNRYETNVCNTARQGMELLADVDSPALKVHLDSYHMNIEEFSMAEAVKTCGDKLGCASSLLHPSCAPGSVWLCSAVAADARACSNWGHRRSCLRHACNALATAALGRRSRR